MAFDRHEISLQTPIQLRVEGESVQTTLGRSIFNDALPANYPFVNYEVGKKQLGGIVNDLAERYTKVEVAASLDALKDAGFNWATRSRSDEHLSELQSLMRHSYAVFCLKKKQDTTT